MNWNYAAPGNGALVGWPACSTRSWRLEVFWGQHLRSSRKGTRWDQVLQTLVSYRLIAPGSECKCMGNAGLRIAWLKRCPVHPQVHGERPPQHQHLFSRLTVHPQVHGERALKNLCGIISDGSSPSAWGTLHLVCVPVIRPRFIPKCMGNALE